jgi:DNA polymerase III epsilon subunit-like protein
MAMLVIDIEASGTEYTKHSIVSLGAIDFANPTRQFYGECRIWEGAHIMEEALTVNGFTESEITDPAKMTEAELVTKFMEWSEMCADRTLTGQNVSFDRDMLKAAIARTGHNWTLPYRTLDTHTMCYVHMVHRGITPPFDEQHKRSALNLDAIMLYCGIPEEPEPHNALTGTKSHAEVASRLLYGRSLLPEFSAYPLPW